MGRSHRSKTSAPTRGATVTARRLGLLHQMIRMGDDALAEFLARHLTWALEMYLPMRQGFGMLGALSPFSAMSGFGSPFGAPPPQRSMPAGQGASHRYARELAG